MEKLKSSKQVVKVQMDLESIGIFVQFVRKHFLVRGTWRIITVANMVGLCYSAFIVQNNLLHWEVWSATIANTLGSTSTYSSAVQEKPFSCFCWLEPVLSEEFLLFTSFDGRKICWESILTEEQISPLIKNLLHQLCPLNRLFPIKWGEQQNILHHFRLHQNFPQQMKKRCTAVQPV